MYRNDFDLLHVNEDQNTRPTRTQAVNRDDNSQARVLWELGIVLAVALGFAAVVNVALLLAA
jgi:hypothetical protein